MKELVEIQKELKVRKTQFNQFGKYKYRSCEDILEAVKPLATARGCYIKLEDNIIEVGGRIYVQATAQIVKASEEDGYTEHEETTAYAREPENVTGMSQCQVTGAASSYARKYALSGLLCIDDAQQDPDGDERMTKPANTEIINSVKNAKTVEELSRIWRGNTKIQNDNKVFTEFKKRKAELINASN